MEQLAFSLDWRDQEAGFSTDTWALGSCDAPPVGQAFWVEHISAKEACAFVRRQRKWFLDWADHGMPVELYAAGRFICLRRLRYGPVRKLTMWDQMEKGDEFLLHPEPTSEDIRLAMGRADRFRRAGRKDIHPWIRDHDGTLWLTCRS